MWLGSRRSKQGSSSSIGCLCCKTIYTSIQTRVFFLFLSWAPYRTLQNAPIKHLTTQKVDPKLYRQNKKRKKNHLLRSLRAAITQLPPPPPLRPVSTNSASFTGPGRTHGVTPCEPARMQTPHCPFPFRGHACVTLEKRTRHTAAAIYCVVFSCAPINR